MKNKIALVTGATSGIGKAAAITLAKIGYDIIATGRRGNRLEELKSELPEGVDFLPLIFDVRDREKVMEILENLPEKWKDIDVLINNAGNAHGIDPVQTANKVALELGYEGLMIKPADDGYKCKRTLVRVQGDYSGNDSTEIRNDHQHRLYRRQGSISQW